MSADATVEVKESAAQEKRQWVRLTKLCNNRCTFCLDSEAQDGSMVPADAVRRRILEGREAGATRLILSGGEPTIHPDYLSFVKAGRLAGYRWVQTISNGRMFSYAKFAQRALAAGLDEATFSIHGHTPALHDALTGVPGSFDQALAGLKNLLGRCVTNVDVVLNKQNVPHLREILEFFMDLGIHEFDLLHTVPFGLAWCENREALFYDPAELAEDLRRGFELRHRPGIYMWTNRLPARYLEGAEDLIQDPKKIHDEVRGRFEFFTRWVDTGEALPCRDERCPFCFLEGFCDRLEDVADARLGRKQAPGGGARIRADASRRFDDAPWPADLAPPKTARVELTAATPAEAAAWLDGYPGAVAHLALVVAPWATDPAPWADLAARADVVRLGPDAPDTGAREALAAWRAAPRKGRLEVPALTALADGLEGAAGDEAFYVPVRERLTVARAQDLDLEAARDLHARTGRPVEGLPPCLGTGATPVPELPELDLTLLDGGGRLDMIRYTDDYIARWYMVKSHRCDGCARTGDCPGIHISGARRFGLGALTPVEE
jgi:MoaA/NifB/PqqE/SkfB family radical SAM enzyme